MALGGAGCRLRALTWLRAMPWAAAAPSGARAASDMPRHMLPGPYPKTPEEWAAAAKKYNMTVEDYKPYPDDGSGYGDYPQLPDRSQHERDPWYEWDHSDLRRNHGETHPGCRAKDQLKNPKQTSSCSTCQHYSHRTDALGF